MLSFKGGKTENKGQKKKNKKKSLEINVAYIKGINISWIKHFKAIFHWSFHITVYL